MTATREVETMDETQGALSRSTASTKKAKKGKATRGRKADQRPVSANKTREAQALRPPRKETLEDDPWVRPTSLQAPPARQGMRQRWIRVGSGGRDDNVNLSRKWREGWRPRPLETMPSSYHAPTLNHSRFGAVVGVEGMILCEMPEERAKRRDQYFHEQNRKMTAAIDQQLRNANIKNPAFGPIMKTSRSVPVREVRAQANEEDLDI